MKTACGEPRIVDQIPIQNTNAEQPALQLGYVTKDDLGTEGDDTPHIPYPTFVPPNVVGVLVELPTLSTPTSIGVVYNEFMEKVSSTMDINRPSHMLSCGSFTGGFRWLQSSGFCVQFR